MSCVCRPSLGFPSLQCGDFLAGGHEIQDCLSGCLPLEGVLAAKLLKYAGNVSLGLNLPIRSLLTAMMQCFHSQYFDSKASNCPCISGRFQATISFPARQVPGLRYSTSRSALVFFWSSINLLPACFHSSTNCYRKTGFVYFRPISSWRHYISNLICQYSMQW